MQHVFYLLWSYYVNQPSSTSSEPASFLALAIPLVGLVGVAGDLLLNAKRQKSTDRFIVRG